MSLTAFVREAIDCYIGDPNTAWLHIQSATDQIALEKGVHALAEDSQAEKISRAKTADALKSRFLEKGSPARKESSVSLATDRQPTRAPNNPQDMYKRASERLARVVYQHNLATLTWYINQNRSAWLEGFPDTSQEVAERDVEEQFDKETISECERFSDWNQIERSYEIAKRSEPYIETYLLRKYLDWLDISVGKLEADEPISCGNLLPDHIKDYLFVASWCNAYGLDAACAVMCGAISEQAIRAKYEKRCAELAERGIPIERIGHRATFGTVIELASRTDKDLPVLSETAARKAREVDKLRSQAAHGDPSFFERAEDVRKSPLALTTELLETLFSFES